MSFFIDTNIALGYTIIHDKWHEKSNNFINNADSQIFWSNLVQKEYTQKLYNIIDEIDIFLKTTEKILKNNDNDFMNYYSFENYILNRTNINELDKIKKHEILEYFWRKNNLEGISETVYLKFKIFNENFKKMYLDRNKELNHKLILHNCGLNNYLRYFDYAMKLHDWGIHKPDCKIIVDAHDCGLTQNELIFVSTDGEMLNKILEHDCSFLSITEFKSCT